MSDVQRNNFLKAFFAHEGKLVDKWEQYISVYDAELEVILRRGTSIDLLEIGVQNGGSLELWAKLLPLGSTITGLDIDPQVSELRFNQPAIKTYILDASDRSQVESAIGDAKYDIIIDDGSHICNEVISSINIFYPRLRSGGVMFIEDLHTSYREGHGGGYRKSGSSNEYLKEMIDLLHIDYLSKEEANTMSGALVEMMRDTLASLTFYDSLAVLRKLVTRKERPWHRLIGGNASQVVAFKDWIGDASRATLGNIVFGELAARSFDTAFMEACGDYANNQRLADAVQENLTLVEGLLCELDTSVAYILGGDLFVNDENMQDQLLHLKSVSKKIKSLLDDKRSNSA